ncbi:Quinate/shikimate dehydrogenase [Sinomonas atrocyanea]|uniref:Shikimate dehydrogenase (NADP(+)) n=1 Tax=Sinomonas atrocyanea TaxID=37927 RepID=A0A127A500_9MICC|nr:shikimate dehydrogenase [Sinomonas atrocyanea]AMM34568.1 Quinate/shikimate dehydrogenase [Sinomonas atrocyanea]GEB63046.1 shikimate dehydrogenase (NADP(+)) [Sinomonas atrocyanea]
MTAPSHLIGLIGANVAGSLSPLLHEREAAAHGLRYAYRTLDLDALGLAPDHAGQLARDAARLGYTGLNVTHPCKQSVIAGLDGLSDDARELGAVNTVVIDMHDRGPRRGGSGAAARLTGRNTDHTGFRTALLEGLPGAALGTVLLVGAGGAGSAVARALLDAGAGTLLVADAEPARAEQLAARLAGRRAGKPAGNAAAADGAGRVAAVVLDEVPTRLAEADGVVNATPIGMVGHPGTPFDASALTSRHWVADVVYRPLETQLVKAARAAGCRVLDGGWMAVAQAADSFELFTGRRADRARMRAHFLELAAQAGTELS